MIATDVIVPVYKDVALTLACLESVLAHSGERLGRLLVINDASPEPEMAARLAALAAAHARVEVVTNRDNLGFVLTCNRALELRRGDVVLLNSDTRVTPGWLDELAAVAYSDDRTACVSPLSNNATLCSVPDFLRATPPDEVDAAVVARATAALPRSSVAPTCVGFCLYLRGAVLDLIGGFDPVFSPGYNEENDWIMRAQALGFVARRAHHAFVYHHGSISFDAKRADLDEAHARILNRRHPHYLPQVRRYCASLEGHLAAHAVRIEASGKLRLALDLRALGPNRVGSNVYARRLAEHLAGAREIALTIVERLPQGLEHLGARILDGASLPGDRLDDVDVIHKPSQVFSASDLPLLFDSPAHAVITHQDMIAHRAEVVWRSDAQAQRYRDMSHFVAHAAQAVIAISEDGRREISAELGLPLDDIAVVYHGMDAAHFAGRREERAALRRDAGLMRPYYLCVGTDFPHKNLANVLGAYQLLRHEWREEAAPPELVFAGATCDVPSSFYKQLAAAPSPGVRHLGEVDDELLAALYQGAAALVFASVYEGFGLPPLEAMAAGTPVLALPISATAEICGDAAVYPARLGAAELADAMRLVLSAEARDAAIAAGTRRVADFTWQRTLERTLAVYHAAARRPSPRSLDARRHAWPLLRSALLPPAPNGIHTARPESILGRLVTRVRDLAGVKHG